MGKIESFTYTCLPALLILIFSEVAVYLSEGNFVTMGILGLLYIILAWWLYEYTLGKFFYLLNGVEEKKEVEEEEEAEAVESEDNILS